MTEIHLPYMEEFAAYLRDTEGLAERTVYRHINNAEFFLSYMSTHFFIADHDCDADELPIDAALISRGPDFLYEFFGYFLPYKAVSSPAELRTIGGSVKKLYRFFGLKGLVSQEIADDVIITIKDEIPGWMDHFGNIY